MNDLNLLANLLISSQPLRQRIASNLLISMTTRGSRNQTLHLTLLSLLTQTVLPESIEIFASDEVANEIRAIQFVKSNPIISVTETLDIGPHTKLIPAIIKYPDKYIVTVDDDTYYWPTWLEELMGISNYNPEAIVGHRAHRIKRDQLGNAAKYEDWEWNIRTKEGVSEADVFLTGVSGILYPPSPFVSNYLDEQLMKRLTPTADDIWFYFASLGSERVRLITGSKMKIFCWPNTQETALFTNNISGANDTQFEMCSQYLRGKYE